MLLKVALNIINQSNQKDLHWIRLTLQGTRVNVWIYPLFKVTLTYAFTTKETFFSFLIVSLSFLVGDVSSAPSHAVYISQFVRFARICNTSNVYNFNDRNLVIKQKLLHQEYCFHKLLQTVTKKQVYLAKIRYKIC